MIRQLKNWEFGALNIYNYKKPGTLKNYFDFVKNNHTDLEGDIVECGVFQGKSLISMGLMLKEIKSNKIVYGYDSFEGFPSIHKNDDLSKFDELYKNNLISKKQYNDVLLNKELRMLTTGEDIDTKNISNSGDFSHTNQMHIIEKCKYLGLDNIKIVKGPFYKTMIKKQKPIKIFAALIDCDLYESYKIALPFVWDKLVKKGYIYLDEYYSLKFPGAKIATDEFLKSYQRKPLKHASDKSGFERWYIKK